MPTSTNKIVPPMNGAHARLVLVQDRVPKTFPWKTWNLKPNVTKHVDDVNGEKRSRLDVSLNYYEGSASMYVVDAEFIRDWLAAQAVRDANVAPLAQSGGIRLEPRNGTRAAFGLIDLIIDDWELSNSARNERIMIPVNWRCTDLKEMKTR